MRTSPAFPQKPARVAIKTAHRVAVASLLITGSTAIALAFGTSATLLGFALFPPLQVQMQGVVLQAANRPFIQPAIPDAWRPYIAERSLNNLTLRLYAGITTLGIHISSNTNLATGLNRPVYYREKGALQWLPAHPLTGRITKSLPQEDGSYEYEPLELYVTSLFWLKPGIVYEVCLLISGATCDADGNLKVSLATRQATNSPTPEAFFTPTRTVIVDPDPAKGDFTAIQAAVNDSATAPGTRIQINAGVYHEAVTIKSDRSGAPGRWLQLYGMPGAVLDGSYAASELFTPGSAWEKVTPPNAVNGDHIYKRPVRDDVLIGWLGDEQLLRHRDSDRGSGWKNFVDANAGEFRDGCDEPKFLVRRSWYMDEANDLIYLRWDSAVDPAGLDLTFSRYPMGIMLDGADWVWVEGLQISRFGNGPRTGAVYIQNGEFNIVRRNAILRNADGISVIWRERGENCQTALCSGDDGSSFNRVEDNTIDNGIPDATLSYCHTKRSAPFFGIRLGGSLGNSASGNSLTRIGENSIQITLAGDMAKATRCNDEESCRDLFPYVLWETDVYDNTIFTNVEGLEPDGAQVNGRLFHNRLRNVEKYLVSLQASQYGPTFVVRNILTRSEPSELLLTETTKNRYPYLHRYTYIYHNNLWLDYHSRPLSTKMYFKEFHLRYRNNVFRNSSGSVASFDNRLDADEEEYAGNADLDYNAYSSGEGSPIVNWVTESGWDDIRTSSRLCSEHGLECHGIGGGGFWPDGLSAPAEEDFTPLSNGKYLDAGEVIPGINLPYYGKKPDIGAEELAMFKRGDSNGDGKMDIGDSIFTLNHLFIGGRQPGCLDAADYTDDGKVNLADAVANINYLFLGSEVPPSEPASACGYDPTPDTLRCAEFLPCAKWE
ncbi:MAG: Uncharacterized protein G01um101431_218 [Parcubacteria group bacterium Gr01-1014_31]|nr:MAG: Uncharacterized protein G01um101431_218 [Parcubacteria group bacterium Gr01-1014_31]